MAALHFALRSACPGAGRSSCAEAPPQVPEYSAFIFNTLLFLIGGFLVMWMAAGFAMLEAGLVRSKNVSMQCLKNIALYSIAGIMYWVVGYNADVYRRRRRLFRHLRPWQLRSVGGCRCCR
jgi:Amt family ammonium transporter